MRSTVRMCVALVVAALAGGATAQERIAVLEFTGRGDPGLLAQLGDEVRSAAADELRGRYGMMTREAMAVLVREMGGVCKEGECEVETARNIGAALVVTGELRLIGKTLVLGIKLHETAKGTLLGAETVRAADPIALLDGCRDAARSLLRRSLPASAAPVSRAPPVQEGRIREEPQASFAAGPEEFVVAFESAPEAAVVQLDGQLLCSTTPCRRRVVAGPHEAVFQKERHAPAAQKFTAAKGAVVKVALAPTFGWVSVETAPAGVGVMIDGADAGKSPVAPREVDAGGVEVLVADPCFMRAGERVAVKAGERRVVKLDAKPRIAGLKVNAEDEKGNALEAAVRVDGADAGTAGATLKVPVCARRVSVPLGTETFEADLQLEEGKLAVVTARPSARPAAPGAPSTQARAARPRQMVRLPGGTFRLRDRNVTVAPFLLDATEVTAGAYAACVAAGRCRPPSAGVHGTYDAATDHPVNYVDWFQAAEYCAFDGKRLPSEAEWEWAARGGKAGTRYPWGDAPPRDQLCWDGEGSRLGRGNRTSTCAVGSHPAGTSPQGVHDLAGNVREWTSSGSGADRVYRGGAWDVDEPAVVAASHGESNRRTHLYYDLGFRCAKSLR